MLVKLLKQNWWVILTIIVCMIGAYKKNTYFNIPVVSNPDATVTFSANDGSVEQTWQADVKRINAIILPYTVLESFEGNVQVSITTDDGENLVLSEMEEIKLSEGEKGELFFPFPVVNTVLGERYHIRLLLEDGATGKIEIPVGTNYAGGKIGAKEMDAALAITVEGIKNSKIFWGIAVLFPICAVAILLMILFQCKWEEVVAIVISSQGIILYLFGLMGHLKTGIYTIYAVAIVAFVFAVYLYNRKNMSIQQFVSPGLIVFWIIFGVIVLINQNVWYGRFDEYSHWGLAVKDMFYNDSLAKHLGTTVLLPRYVPFVTLIEYYYVYLNGLYVQDIVYIAFQVIMLSYVIMLCKPLQKSRSLWIPVILSMVSIPPIFFEDFSNCIYVDPLLGFMVFYILACYFSEEKMTLRELQIISGLAALVLTKDMGLVFAGLAVIVVLVHCIWNKYTTREKWSKDIRFFIGRSVIILVCWMSWQVYMSIPLEYQNVQIVDGMEKQARVVEEQQENQNVEMQNTDVPDESAVSTKVFQGTVGASGLSLKGILNLLKGQGSDTQKQIMKNAAVQFFDGETYYIGSIGFSYMDMLLIISLLAVIAILFIRDKKKNSDIKVLFALLLAAGICYGIVLCILYLFAFPVEEALKLKSMKRYLGSFLMPEALILVYIVIDEISNIKDDKNKRNIIVLLISGILIAILPVQSYIVKNRDQSITADMVYWSEETEEIFRSFSRKGEKTAFICADGGNESYYIFRNTVSPVISEREYVNIVATEDIAKEQKQWYAEQENANNATVEVLSEAEWKGYLQSCDYLFVLHTDPFFEESYKEILDSDTRVENGSIYQIQKDAGDIELSIVGRTGVKKYK